MVRVASGTSEVLFGAGCFNQRFSHGGAEAERGGAMQSDHAHVSLVVRKMQGSRRRNAEGTGTVSSLAQLLC